MLLGHLLRASKLAFCHENIDKTLATNSTKIGNKLSAHRFRLQDLIDKTRSVLVGQRHSLQMLLASSGLPSMSESDDMAYANLNQVMDSLFFFIHSDKFLCVHSHILFSSFSKLFRGSSNIFCLSFIICSSYFM